MSLYAELKRRNVFRVAAAYVVVGWLVLQLADILLDFVGAPDWVGKAIIALLVLGFVPALAVAWIFEVTPEGVKRDDGSASNGHRARRLDVITLVAVVIVAVMVFWQHLQPPEETPPTTSRGSDEVGGMLRIPTGDAASEDRMAVEPIPVPENSIAVLPFANRSAEDDTQYFVDGVHDDLLTQLARLSELKVISRTSVMEYRDTTKNMRTIGEELGVASILEGAVQRAGERVRINAQLIDARTDEHLWAQTFDRELTAANVFDIQTDIASAIATALVSTLDPGRLGDELTGGAPTQNAEAYDLYLRGRASADLVDIPATLERIALYRQAVELDPGFALAMGELGFELTNLYWFQTKDPAHRDEGGEWIRRALTMAPNDPRLHWIHADHLYHGHLDYEAALAELDVAARGMPGSADVFALRGWILRRSGDLRGAEQALSQAARLDPRNGFVLGDLIYTYGVMGDLGSAEVWQQRLERVPGVSPYYRYFYPLVRATVAGDLGPMRDYLAEVGPEVRRGTAETYLLPYLERDWARAEAAIDEFDDDPVLFQWQFWPKDFLRARLAYMRGDGEALVRYAAAARPVIDAFIEEFPDNPRGYTTRAYLQAFLGEADSARASIAKARAVYPPETDALGSQIYVAEEARIIAIVGDTPEVLETVEAAVAAPASLYSFDGLVLDPVFDRHRDHLAYRELEARLSGMYR